MTNDIIISANNKTHNKKNTRKSDPKSRSTSKHTLKAPLATFYETNRIDESTTV